MKPSIADNSRLPHIEMKPFPQMSVEDFNEWISKLSEYFFDADHEFILGELINDENSTDEELSAHLITCGTDKDFVTELIAMREYFWDFRYSQNISL
jgi:hypothetical protein